MDKALLFLLILKRLIPALVKIQEDLEKYSAVLTKGLSKDKAS